MSQRVDLIIRCVDDTRKAMQEITSSFQGFAAKVSVANYAIRSSYQTVRDVLDKVVLSTARLGEELLRMSQTTGMSAGELYALKNVAERSNVSLGDLGQVFNNLSRNIFEARNSAGSARAIFQSLGIDAAKPLSQILRDTAKTFAELKDGEDKMALAMQLFGRDGARIIPVLNDIASGAEEVSDVFDDDLARASGELNNNFTTLRQTVEKVSVAIGGSLIPALNQLFDDIENRRGLTGLLVEQFEDMWNVAKEVTKPLFDVSKAAGDALDNLLGYNKAVAETQRLMKNSPKNVSQLEFTFPMGKKDVPQIITGEQRRKFVDNEENMADLVDKAGNQIIDALNKRAQAYEDAAGRINAAREGEIVLQLKELDLAEQDFRISKSDAVQKRVHYYEELRGIQEAYLAGLDKERDPASWYAQMNAINETRDALIKLNFELEKQTGTLTEGARYGFQQYMHDAKTAFEYGADMAQATASAMEGFFASISFDGMKGKLKSLGDYFEDFLTSMQRSVSQILGQLAVQGAIGGLGGFFGSGASTNPFASVTTPLFKHSGGYIPRFHSGGLASDEIPAILQRGEYVVSRKGVETLDRINQGGNPGSPVVVQQSVHFNVSAIDGQGTEQFFRKNSGMIQKVVGDGVDRNRAFAAQVRGNR